MRVKTYPSHNNKNISDIAIVGGGFAGLMLVTHLVRLLPSGSSIQWFEPSAYLPRGIAYSTPRDEHILNVCANNMGAFADDAAHFYKWLLKNNHCVHPVHFVSRRLFGDYLDDIWHSTQQHAQEKNIDIQKQHQKATNLYSCNAGWVVNNQQAKVVVLASGNPFDEQSSDNLMVSAPRLYPYHTLSTTLPHLPVVIIGTGLTAIDTINSIQRVHPQRQIICVSRTGLFPRPHLDFEAQDFTQYTLSAQWHTHKSFLRLSTFMHCIRAEIALAQQQGYQWQQVFDAIRPLTQKLWQQLLPATQKRFLRRYATLWNVHRHRMPAAAHAHLQTLLNNNQLRVQKAGLQRVELSPDNHHMLVHLTTGNAIHAAVVFDCMGPRYHALTDGLLQQVLQQGDVQLAACGYGLKQIDYRVSISDKPPLYAVGALLLGDLFETVAVPELRGQALTVAKKVAAHFLT